jgi:hypothetical protein
MTGGGHYLRGDAVTAHDPGEQVSALLDAGPVRADAPLAQQRKQVGCHLADGLVDMGEYLVEAHGTKCMPACRSPVDG